jgi:dienelactone hydrolase
MLDAMLRHAAAAVVAAVVLAGCATIPVAFPNATPGRPLEIRAEEFRPPGPGPFPAVVLLHGCHGVLPGTRGWGRWFAARGYVALVVDSWTPRRVGDYCVPGPDIPSTERFDDAVGALRWLQGRAYVDRAHIGVVGWSHGGVFSIALVNGPSLERARVRGVVLPEPGYRAAIGVYPGGCYSLVEEQVVRPLLVLIGEADDWTPASQCREMVDAMRSRGADAQIVLYPGAYHFFDDARWPRQYLAGVENREKPGGCCGATVAYDAAADADTRRRVEEFFGYHLKAR